MFLIYYSGKKANMLNSQARLRYIYSHCTLKLKSIGKQYFGSSWEHKTVLEQHGHPAQCALCAETQLPPKEDRCRRMTFYPTFHAAKWEGPVRLKMNFSSHFTSSLSWSSCPAKRKRMSWAGSFKNILPLGTNSPVTSLNLFPALDGLLLHT